jgi:hypothetical protein
MGHFIFSKPYSLLNIYMENSTQITVADLGALHGIVDLAASRGAFRGAELTQVGAIYDKLTTFLNDVMAQAKAAAETNATTEDGETITPDAAKPTSDTPQGE